MKREGHKLKPTFEEERAEEIASQKALAAQLNAMAAQFKKPNGKQP